MDGVGAGVGVMDYHVVFVDRGIVERMVGLDAYHRLDVPIHALRRREAVDRILLMIPHKHPRDHMALPGRESDQGAWSRIQDRSTDPGSDAWFIGGPWFIAGRQTSARCCLSHWKYAFVCGRGVAL